MLSDLGKYIESLSEQNFIEKSGQVVIFWNDVTKYTSVSKDESFVQEIAYMMVTLHRTGG